MGAMKNLFHLSFAVTVALLLAGCATIESPRILAHRGGRAEYDDNAAGGFAVSLAAGITGFETDVRETADGALVIMHDSNADRTTTSKGDVTKMSLAEFKSLKLKKSGETAPTLEEVLRPLAGRKDVWIELEMKSCQGNIDAYTRKIHETASRIMEPGTFLMTSFNAKFVESTMRQFPDPKSALISGHALDDSIGANGVSPRLKGTTKEMVDKAHAAGLRVCLWMVQTKADYELAKSLGADTVTSDHPVRLLGEIRD